MIRLIIITLLSSVFFSTTYVLNELMSASGGHWFWSASLRYLFTLFILTFFIVVKFGIKRIVELWEIFISHYLFWCLTGCVGFGIFYAGLCYAADNVSGWVVAATFMFTVVSSLIVLIAFGHRFEKKVIFYALLIFMGVLLANMSDALATSSSSSLFDTSLSKVLLYGAVPCIIAAFSYPIGSQLVWQASYNARVYNSQQANKHSKLKSLKFWSVNNEFQPLTTFAPRVVALDMDDYFHEKQKKIEPEPLPLTNLGRLFARIPTIHTTLLRNSFNKVWLMTLGSFPFWLVLGVIVRPNPPDLFQTVNTFLVALFSGVIATSIFLYAREQANSSNEVAVVDATQASEVIFALLGGMILLKNPAPGLVGISGILLILIGLVLFAKSD